MRVLGWLVFGVLFFVGFVQSSFADRYYLFDLHGTLLNTTESRGGSFRSTYKLFRVDHRANVLQPIADGPREIEVSIEELENIFPYLSQGDNRPGSMNYFKLGDGTLIRPGEYRLDLTHSFVHFRTPKEGDADYGHNYLLEDLEAAIERDGIGWQGPHWEDFVRLVNEHPEQVGIITSSGYEASDWDAFFTYLIEEGHIQERPNPHHIHNISLRTYDTLSLHGNSATQKSELLRKFVKALSRKRPQADADSVLNPDATGYGAYHTIVFYDDNQQTLERVYQTMSEVVSSRIADVKIVIVNAGSNREVEQSGRPRAYVIRSNGKFREARNEEILGEAFKKAKPIEPKGCKKMIAGFKK